MKYLRLLLTTLITLSFASSPVHAGEESDGWLRQRIKNRLIERMASQPAPESNASVDTVLNKAGDYYFSIPWDGLNRMYHIHIPKTYSAKTATPLLLAFHGGGGDMDYMARDEYYGLITKSEKAGFILIFPNGYSKLQSGKFATWNAGNCCGDARDKRIDDVGFIRQIITNTKKQINIDATKIFATGMSNGGMMSHRLACEMADTFKAIATVAGTDNTTSCAPSRPVSVLHIHAINDTHVLFNGGAGKDSFRDISKVTEFTSVPETIHRWQNRNQCTKSPQRVLSVAGAYCDLFDECANGTKVKLCVTETGAHSWPGGHKPRGEAPSQAISANDIMWDFFMSLK